MIYEYLKNNSSVSFSLTVKTTTALVAHHPKSVSLPQPRAYIHTYTAINYLGRKITKNFTCYQGDQIVRIFAYWAFVLFGSFLTITEVAKSLWAFFHEKNYVLIFTRNVFDTICGYFSTHSSGHPIHTCMPNL
jgi:hypothetical protein